MTAIPDYKDHPLSTVLPMMSQGEMWELENDIRENGLRFPIMLLEGQILDGRNRYKACKKVGVEAKFQDFNGQGDPLAFIVSVNVKRRHLTASQKAMVVAKIAQLPRGNPELENRKNPNDSQNRLKGGIGNGVSYVLHTAAQAAKDVGVGKSTVEKAKQVLREAPADDVKAVERGEKSVATVVREIKKAKEEKAAPKVEKLLDKTGYPVPDDVYEDWQGAESFRQILNELQRVKLHVEKALDSGELMFREISNSTIVDLKNAWTALHSVLPYAVCPTCQGRTRETCTVCKQRGYVSKFGYEHWFPKETIALRERAIKK